MAGPFSLESPQPPARFPAVDAQRSSPTRSRPATRPPSSLGPALDSVLPSSPSQVPPVPTAPRAWLWPTPWTIGPLYTPLNLPLPHLPPHPSPPAPLP
jgi:hypothetical protein